MASPGEKLGREQTDTRLTWKLLELTTYKQSVLFLGVFCLQLTKQTSRKVMFLNPLGSRNSSKSCCVQLNPALD